jgi:hypothetical protein
MEFLQNTRYEPPDNAQVKPPVKDFIPHGLAMANKVNALALH